MATVTPVTPARWPTASNQESGNGTEVAASTCNTRSEPSTFSATSIDSIRATDSRAEMLSTSRNAATVSSRS